MPPRSGLPPLVAPAAELTGAEVARYSRHLILPDLGVQGQLRLKNARVLVIGAGGLGSPTLLYLAAAGVGTLGIVDFDIVDESNLQRQIIHGQSDVGRPKAHSARDAITELNPLVDVRLHEFRLRSDNAVELFADYDLILDGTDNFATRYLVNDAAVLAGKPYVWGSIYRFAGQVSVFWEDAPDGRGLNYRDLYTEPPPPGLVVLGMNNDRADTGNIGSLKSSGKSIVQQGHAQPFPFGPVVDSQPGEQHYRDRMAGQTFHHSRGCLRMGNRTDCQAVIADDLFVG